MVGELAPPRRHMVKGPLFYHPVFKCRAEFSLLSRSHDSPGPPLRPEAREGICTFTQQFHRMFRVASYNENGGRGKQKQSMQPIHKS